MIIQSTRSQTSGFTLVELAIVLVIIGLLVGGVLVGQDLIKGSEIKKTVTKVQEFNQAALTFRGKYNGIPGDITDARAESFGLNAGRTGAVGIGDGNGLVEGCAANATALGCENILIWDDLTVAKLMPESLGPQGTAAAVIPSITNANMGTYLPNGPIRESQYFHVIPHNGKNYYAFGAVSAGLAGVITVADALTPIESDSIDNKLDDGRGLTGTVVAINSVTANTGYTLETAAAPSATACVSNVAGNPYNVGDQYQTVVTCQLAIRSNF